MKSTKMDDAGKDHQKRFRRHQGWKFTFVGGSPAKQDEGRNKAKFTPELVDELWSMKEVFPLSNTRIGDRVVIRQILSGKSMKHRLSQMGLDLGSEVRVISKIESGSVIISIQDEQIGLGAGMANQVIVGLAAKRI